MKKKYFLITVLSLILGLISCSEDDLSENDIISSKSWVIESKIISPSINVGGMEIFDIMIIESEDSRNYSFKFNSDGTLFQYDSMKNLIFESTWTLSSDNTQLIFSEPVIYNYPIVGDVGLSTITIISLSSTKIIGTIPALYDGTNYELTITLI